MALSKNPAYNLKAVLKETKLAADTLRAWERRYGLPMPQRTSGGHRLYSQYDIETIKWLLARQTEGLSISHAVASWNEKISSNLDPLAGFNPAGLSFIQTTPAIYISPDMNLDSLRAQWIAACMKFSESSSEQVLNQAFSMFPVESVCIEVLQKGMSEIGNLWYENKSTVHQEHFASGLAMRRLDSLLNASPAPVRNQTVIVGCPSNEWHTFIPLLLSLFLRRRGLKVIYLGANVPSDDFEETVSTVHGNLVILVAQTLASAAALQRAAYIFAKQHMPVGFGGRIFNLHPGLVDTIPGHFLGNTLDSSLDEVEKNLKGKVKAYTLKTPSQKYRSAYQAFISNRTHIESTIKEIVQPLSIDPEGLNTGIQFLGDSISAALQLGDMEYASDEMDWVKVLMESRQRPSQELAYFIETYSQAADKHINGQGELIKSWLKSQAASL